MNSDRVRHVATTHITTVIPDAYYGVPAGNRRSSDSPFKIRARGYLSIKYPNILL